MKRGMGNEEAEGSEVPPSLPSSLPPYLRAPPQGHFGQARTRVSQVAQAFVGQLREREGGREGGGEGGGE